jgi:ubiquinone biosynthesis protein COQ9
MNPDIQAQKQLILESALKLIQKHGLSVDTLNIACQRVGLPDGCAEIIFPRGVDEFLELYFENLHAQILERRSAVDPEVKGVTASIKQALSLVVDVLSENKGAAIAIINFLSLPHKLIMEVKLVQQHVSAIWYDFGGDKSLDFNYYSKRMLLHAVYEGMLRYFIVDCSDDHQDTKGFIDRRINTALMVGKTASDFIKKVTIFS